MKLFLLTSLIAFSFHVQAATETTTSAATTCDNETVDSLTEKALYFMAKRYKSEKVGMGIAIQNGTKITTSVAIFQGKGGNDGVKVDRIGSITIDLEKCDIHNTLIGTFDVLDVK
ncbi:MAG: hypothetical protein H7256_02395 [Bdellovibrio sp.]|nr:hypothetical protein [Bdellovibrio sp.]